MRFLVVGAGSWGTVFTRVLLDRGHDVVLACRSRKQAEAIASTGWNPRYLQGVDLSAAEAVALADAPGDVDVAVVAVPGPAFGEERHRARGRGRGRARARRQREGVAHRARPCGDGAARGGGGRAR